ncbi:diguanylate cyclase domain-containing protein [Fusibacter bizertensis]
MQSEVLNQFQNSIEYIEKRLVEPIKLEQVASEACMCLSSYYELFKGLTQFTLKEYIRKRRLTEAAAELVDSKQTVLEIALKYQYETYEAFSRAFKLMFGLSPTQYRKAGIFVAAYPRLKIIQLGESEGIQMMSYEMNKEHIIEHIERAKTGFIMDVDIDHFITVNENYGRDGGDKVLIEVPRRIKKLLKNKDINSEVMRFGGDEFIIVFEQGTQNEIEALADEILEAFITPIAYNAQEIKITVTIGIAPIHHGKNAEIYIDQVNATMINAKKLGRNIHQTL